MNKHHTSAHVPTPLHQHNTPQVSSHQSTTSYITTTVIPQHQNTTSHHHNTIDNHTTTQQHHEVTIYHHTSSPRPTTSTTPHHNNTSTTTPHHYNTTKVIKHIPEEGKKSLPSVLHCQHAWLGFHTIKLSLAPVACCSHSRRTPNRNLCARRN